MKKSINKKPELLAPAGNYEKMKTAFLYGADAVYAGIPEFSLRERVNTFDLGGIRQSVRYAHKLGKKFYVTVNLIAHNKHVKKMVSHITSLKTIGPDALIVSDPGASEVIKKIWPSAPLTLSTQANCTNSIAASFWQKQGFKRIILGREVTLAEASEIKSANPKLEVECFVHGALCMAYSGRCFISKWASGRSANLGDCSQPCRWEYDLKLTHNQKGEAMILEEEVGMSYILNSKDLCLLKRVPELVNAGLDSFKIEGRAKSVYYLATVVGAYRRAIDLSFENKIKDKDKKKEIDKIYCDLETRLYNRGYTEGFMFENGAYAQNIDSSHKECGWEYCGQVIKTWKSKKSDKKFELSIKVHNTLVNGELVEILSPAYDIMELSIVGMRDNATGEMVDKAHGGQSQIVIIGSDVNIAEGSIIRRQIKQ